MKIRARISKIGLARFLSHLDLQQTLERSLRRAGLPVAYSQGFTPRPRCSFAGALATGCASAGEYVDIELVAPMDPDVFREQLDRHLPAGLRVVAARPVADGPALMSVLDVAEYLLRVAVPRELTPAEAREAVAAFLAQPRVLVAKETRAGARKEVDIRPLVLGLEVVEAPPDLGGPPAGALGAPGTVVLRALVSAGPRAHLRPDDLIRALGAAVPALAGAQAALVLRVDVYAVAPDGRLRSPWEL